MCRKLVQAEWKILYLFWIEFKSSFFFLEYCPYPGTIDNGKILLVGSMGNYDYRPYVKKVINDRQVVYECDKGFVLEGGPVGATCVDGHWRPKKLPKYVLNYALSFIIFSVGNNGVGDQ